MECSIEQFYQHLTVSQLTSNFDLGRESLLMNYWLVIGNRMFFQAYRRLQEKQIFPR